MKFAEDIFKAYDIRGVSNNELTAEVVHNIGRALADFLPEGEVAVGRDMRPDSAHLAQALIAGLITQGRQVKDINQCTSDMIYFAVGKYGLAGGAMVTASHNPGQYNGIKLTGKGVVPIGTDSGLEQIKQALREDKYNSASPGGKRLAHDILDDWTTHALKLAGPIEVPLKVGFDFGNGMAAIDLPALRTKTPLQIEALYTELDGTFPNHVANPLLPENMVDISDLVQEKKLDLGVAFDGDGDRAFLVDERGRTVPASLLGALLARATLEDHPGATILYNVITSNIVPETVSALHGHAQRTRVGHSFIKAQMRATGAELAVEHSGHFYFKDNYFADSGLIAALRAISIIGRSGQKLSELIAPFARYADSGEINIEVADKVATLKRVKEYYHSGQQDELDGLTVRYGAWWFNLRPSNTEPFLRLNVESGTEALTKEKTDELLALIKA